MSVYVAGSILNTVATALSACPAEYFQAADAETMGTIVQEWLTANAAGAGDEIVGLSLAGAGDGHTFVVEVIHAAAGSAGGGVLDDDGIRVRFYIASTAADLAVARAKVVAEMTAEAPPTQGDILLLADEQVAGGAKGTRFMGMVVAQWTAPVPPPVP